MKKKTKHRARVFVWALAAAAVAFAALSFWSWFHYAPPPEVPPAEFDTRHPPEALRSDLDFMLQTLEEVHPDLYFYTPKETIASRKRRLSAEIDHAMTRREFYPIVAAFAASVGDGHTAALPPREEIRQFIEQDGLWFPFDLAAFGERGLQVRSVFADDCPIRPGDWITAVGGQPVEALFGTFLEMKSGEKAFYRELRVLRDFALDLWLRGFRSPFPIEWSPRGSAAVRHSLTVDGVPWERMRAAKRKEQNASSFDYAFRRLDGEVGYLDFRRMRDLGRFEAFLREVFEGMRHERARGLIIDLRRNGGGSTRLGDALLSYITDKPYRQIARMELKVSRQKKRSFKNSFLPAWLQWLPLQYIHPAGRKILATPEGGTVTWEFEPAAPPDNPLRFHGPVCVLIGPRTFSSAQKLANAIKDYGLATLIGEETGGNPNAFGEMLVFRLPRTRLEVGVSTKRYVRANGDADWKGGILPDIEVKQAPADLERGVDTVLEFAREWVLGRGAEEARGTPPLGTGTQTTR